MTEENKEQQTERRVLRAMRKTLSSVIKDATPRPGMEGFLSEDTVEQIRECLGIIAAREKELADSLELTPAKPMYPDQERTVRTVQVTAPIKSDDKH
ncbi:MAG: segregation and condensation protein A [Thiobacillaceae bacterium]